MQSLADNLKSVTEKAPLELVTYGVAGLVGVTVLVKITRKSALDVFPTVGSSGLLGPYGGALKFLRNCSSMIRAGYSQYGGKPFKIAALGQWLVVVSEPKLVEELRKAPDEHMSFTEATNDALKIEYTLGYEIHHNAYHVPIIRSQLTRNLTALYPEIRDEIVVAFEETLQLNDHEWTTVPALDTAMKVICRTSNRLFVGLPLCMYSSSPPLPLRFTAKFRLPPFRSSAGRNADWMDLNIEFTVDVLKGGIIINMFPEFLAPLVGKLFTNVPAGTRRAEKHLRPIIEERQRFIDEYGRDWADKPNDMLAWLMDEAEGDERSVRLLAQRMLTVNFSAIHASPFPFMHTANPMLMSSFFADIIPSLYHLAANPQYVQPLREEIEAVVAKEGWSKIAMTKMRKVDSFLKETQRYDGIGSLSMSRKALKDFTFSDGTFIPKGTIVSVASRAIHHDSGIYDDADRFDPFRFADLRAEDGEAMKHQMVSTNPDFLSFGHGRHACPGRFFAANELKTMLAHVVMAYDVKLADGAPRPELFELGSGLGASPTAKVMFRKRV
ncbi:cytochrome P450 [Hygrophoropsis aurantiaca]|uniref:Cytochrome P450 n=1 Tax=Hygrophoropsis aurantiaca TaxID=72124 RepID=A0ACB8A124_9AGAM|nr:cytochrome P450 [Hygrophoropsis aurantiaca]